MATSALKMVIGALSNRKQRTFEDFPEWVAACEKLRVFADEHNAVDAKLKAITGTLTELSRRRSTAVDEAVRARLDMSLAPQRAALIDDREKIEFDLQVARETLARQNDLVQEIEGRCAYEIVQEARPEHEVLLRNTRAAVFALAAALDAEQEFRARLTQARVSVASLPTIPHRIWHAVGSRRNFNSGANESDRIISQYLGEPWDHSRVVA